MKLNFENFQIHHRRRFALLRWMEKNHRIFMLKWMFMGVSFFFTGNFYHVICYLRGYWTLDDVLEWHMSTTKERKIYLNWTKHSSSVKEWKSFKFSSHRPGKWECEMACKQVECVDSIEKLFGFQLSSQISPKELLSSHPAQLCERM